MKIKDFIKNNVHIISVVALMLGAYSFYQVYNWGETNAGIINVNGVCLKKIAKDKTGIQINVKFNDKNSSSKALSGAKESYIALTKFVESLKEKDKSIEMQSASFSIIEDKTWSSHTGKYVYNGFTAEMALSISADDPMIIDEVIKFASENKNIFIQSISNYVSTAKMKDETEKCLAEAIKNAKDKAKMLVKSAGHRLGKLESVYVNGDSVGGIAAAGYAKPVLMSARKVVADAEMNLADAPILQSEDYELNVSVSARFKVK